MTQGEVLAVCQEAIMVTLRLSAPLLIVSIVLGLIVAIFQAATQIHEQTLTFVPKFLAILVVMGLLGSTLLSTLQDFFRQMLVIIVGS